MAKPSVKVVMAVAAAEGKEPTELEERLAEVIDPQSLDRLFADRASAVETVTFTFCGYRVTVTDGGIVTLGDSETGSE